MQRARQGSRGLSSGLHGRCQLVTGSGQDGLLRAEFQGWAGVARRTPKTSSALKPRRDAPRNRMFRGPWLAARSSVALACHSVAPWQAPWTLPSVTMTPAAARFVAHFAATCFFRPAHSLEEASVLKSIRMAGVAH
mmetsp:Transcript_100277/g.311927  ORF Transcript_100277/g.311927 Transcript_100277/m.311927 type:complete len:136 (+) Transcript_100277:1098-1505(+)